MHRRWKSHSLLKHVFFFLYAAFLIFLFIFMVMRCQVFLFTANNLNTIVWFQVTDNNNNKKNNNNSNTLPRRNHTKQLQTHNRLTYDVENTNGTNKGRDLLLANKPWIALEKMSQRILNHRRASLQNFFSENNTRRKNLAKAWIDYKKAYDMVLQGWIMNCIKKFKISNKV